MTDYKRYYPLEVEGQHVTVRTNRSHALLMVRPAPVTTAQGTYVAFANVVRTSDDARMLARQADRGTPVLGCHQVVVDLAAGTVTHRTNN